MTYVRVERRTFKQAEGRRGYYDVTLTLSNHGLGTALGTGAGSTDGFPYAGAVADTTEFCCTQLVAGAGASDIRPDPVYRGTFVGIAHDALIHVAAFAINGDRPASDWTSMAIALSWNGGAITYVAVESENYGAGGPFTPNMCWNAGSLSACTGTEGGTPPTTVSGSNKPTTGTDVLEIFGISGLSNSTSNITFCLTVGAVYDSLTGLEVLNEVAIPDPAGTQAPNPGNAVGPETVTMSGADGTTVAAFAVSSLRVFVDDTDQTGAITAQDGTAKTFSLGFTPKTGEVVTVYYIAA
jgi:hypothetical protein